ncbi:MAG: [Fe-Fe] hydrogenase large subunit C-terminal domain-containing protein [Acutalibacteraceae bacterium]|nr:[Fe-Fe] hydrogenase large subunit C-terminal domain-containing protein [Oscillospiraceae bacterium]
MNYYKHSVELDVEKCTGCTTCIRHCPTEAIRIKDGHAHINTDRCIDCGECIRVCQHKAKKAMCSKFEHYLHYKWKIALPAPALFGQFDGLEDINYVIQGLHDIGFDDVFEVAKAAELVSAYTRLYLKMEGIKKPVISSACPVISRLIALRFPYLKDNVMPLLPPMEVAAILARAKAKKEHPELKDEDIGIFFISPCAAKVSYIRNGYGDYKSNINVVVSLSEIYFLLVSAMKKDKTPQQETEAGVIGIGWATSGGEASALFNDRYLAADGIENCIKILDQIENGNIPQLEFVELNACIGGCVGGVMTIENPFIAKTRLQTVRRYMPVSRNHLSAEEQFVPEEYFLNTFPSYTPINRLSNNLGESMRMMSRIQQIRQSLPGIDCGACGSPTCRAFAEDLVRGKISPDSKCVVLESQQNKNDTEERQ